MAGSTIQLKIVTPERIVVDIAVTQVSIPTEQGEITVLPNHVPLVGLLKTGELQATTVEGSETLSMAIAGGFVEVTGDQVTVLADMAVRAEEIDETEAQAAHDRALQLMENAKHQDNVDYAALAAQIERELTRLKVVRKRKARI